MSDKDGKKPLGVGGGLGGGRPGQVKQSFSHGRTHNVVVETKRRAGAGAVTSSLMLFACEPTIGRSSF